MISAIKQPIVVHVTTGGGGLDWGQVLGAIVVLGIGLLTVYAANKRHRQQLAHDTELRAEELAHDRAIRDRENLRKTVSLAIEGVTDTARSLSDFELDTTTYEKAHLETKNERETTNVRQLKLALKRKQDDALRCTLGMVSNGVQLRLILGKDHEVFQRHKALVKAANDWLLLLTVNDNCVTRTDKQKKKLAAQSKDFPTALDEFETSCQAMFAIR